MGSKFACNLCTMYVLSSMHFYKLNSVDDRVLCGRFDLRTTFAQVFFIMIYCIFIVMSGLMQFLKYKSNFSHRGDNE